MSVSYGAFSSPCTTASRARGLWDRHHTRGTPPAGVGFHERTWGYGRSDAEWRKEQRYVPGGAPFSFLCGIDEVRLRVRRSGSLLCLRPCSKSCFVEEKRNGRATCAGVLAGLAARGVEDM